VSTNGPGEAKKIPGRGNAPTSRAYVIDIAREIQLPYPTSVVSQMIGYRYTVWKLFVKSFTDMIAMFSICL